MYIFKFIFTFYFLILGASIQAFEGYDECGELKAAIKQSIAKANYDDGLPWITRSDFGFTFYPENDGYVPDYADNIYHQTKTAYDDNDVDWNTFWAENFDTINGIKINELEYEEYKKILLDESITIKTVASDKEFIFTKRDTEVLEVLISPNVDGIYAIDPKNGSFSAKFSLKTLWEDYRFLNITKEIHTKGMESQKRLGVESIYDQGFYCVLSERFIEELGLDYPKIEPKNFQSQQDKIPATFSLNYYAGDLDIDEHVVIEKNQIFQGKILKDYKLKKFPFDEQSLDFYFVPVENYTNAAGSIILAVTELGVDAADTLYSTFKNNNWESIDYNYGTAINYSTYIGENINVQYISLSIKRNFEYYIFKLLLPILLLLGLTWSIFWIDLHDLETRITISIVTFLALIAYNFVIDNDLAKLSYLTFLDCVVLVSYLFAGLPTFMAIYCKQKVIDNEIEWGQKINSISKVAFPAFYALSLGFLVVLFEINFN
jgi:hypothetical protein